MRLGPRVFMDWKGEGMGLVSLLSWREPDSAGPGTLAQEPTGAHCAYAHKRREPPDYTKNKGISIPGLVLYLMEGFSICAAVGMSLGTMPCASSLIGACSLTFFPQAAFYVIWG